LKGISQLQDGRLPGPLDLLTPSAEARTKVFRPFVDGLDDDPVAFATDQYLTLSFRESTLAREADRLAAAILK
jgi:hypothetical protein